jgi:hypothetical protein
MKKREPTEAARLNSKIKLAGPAPTSAAWDMATGSNRVLLAPSPQHVVEGGGDKDKMDNEDQEEETAGEA